MRDSLLRLTGRDLLDYPHANSDDAAAAFEAPFALVSHDQADDPIFTYANQTALTLFEMDWAAFTHLPSRLSAEQVARIAKDLLANDLIQTWTLFSAGDELGQSAAPRVTSRSEAIIREIDLNTSLSNQ